MNRRRIFIIIPESELSRTLGWFRQGMDEWAVRTYLIKDLKIMEESLSLDCLVGFNIFFRNRQEADIVLKRGAIYYLIETKQKGKYYRGWKYLAATVECFEVEMNEHKETVEEVVAVLATSSVRQECTSVEKLDWFQEPLE